MLPVKPKKQLGQHFLNDRNIAAKIAGSLVDLDDQSVIVEIGPGSGFLTRFLLNLSGRLELIETDRESVDYLTGEFPQLSGQIHHADVLSLDLRKIAQKPVHVIGNMPYNISGPLLFMALEQRDAVLQWVGMLQKEVVDRIVAKPSTKAYGILSVLLQAYFDATQLFQVPPHVFIPPPKVHSSVVRLQPRQTDVPLCDYHEFKLVVKTAFNQRRKTMRNSLKSLFPADVLSEPVFNKRPEELGWRDFEKLLLFRK